MRFLVMLLLCIGLLAAESGCGGVERYPEGSRSGDRGGYNGGDY